MSYVPTNPFPDNPQMSTKGSQHHFYDIHSEGNEFNQKAYLQYNK